MESSLHRQLKEVYAKRGAEYEVKLGRFRIDVVNPKELVEIQHGSLAAIRDKVAKLLADDHRLLIVKPIIARKMIVKRKAKDDEVKSQRYSPKRGTILDLFNELIYFCRVFPHPKLRLEVPLVEVEEWRYPGHGRRRRWRKNDHVVEDQKLVKVQSTHRFKTERDLLRLLPKRLPTKFHTGHLAEKMDCDRWIAQRITYCLRNIGSIEQCGKQGNAILYQKTRKTASKSASKKTTRSLIKSKPKPNRRKKKKNSAA